MSLGTKALSAINKKVNRKMILRAKVNYKNISSIILFLKSGFYIKSCETKNLVMFKNIT